MRQLYILRKIRDDSFRNVLHTVRPASMLVRLDRMLTPLKVGIAYLNMMRALILQETVWPGYITASINNNDRQARLGELLGWINVNNSPPISAGNTSIQSGNDGYNSTITPDAEIRIITNPAAGTIGELSTLSESTRERSWLNLFFQMTNIFAKAPSVSVTTTIPPGSRPDLPLVSFNYHDQRFDPHMEANITISRFGNRALTYDILVKAWLQLGVRAARRDMWDNVERAEIRINGRPSANITFGRT